MNIQKDKSDDRLADLFREIPLESTSSDFTEKLMLRIEKEAIKSKQKEQWSFVGLIAAGIAAIVGLPTLVLYLIGFQVPEPQEVPVEETIDVFEPVSTSFQSLDINPQIFVMFTVVLFLLIADTLFRRYKPLS